MDFGHEAGVLHVVRSVVQLPSGQGALLTSGTLGGRGAHAATVGAHEESRQRTGASGGQMNDSGHCDCESTQSEPTPGSGHENWPAAQGTGSALLQSSRHDPSTQRELPSGHVTCVGHSASDATHSPPGQRSGLAVGHEGTTAHCWLL